MKRLHFQGIPVLEVDDFYSVCSCDLEPTGNYYFLSNDQLTLWIPRDNTRGDAVILGVANPHFLHVISLLSCITSCKRIVAVDSNLEQLEHFNRLRNTILQSHNRIEYLQRLFKVRFNSRAIALLQSVNPSHARLVRGGLEKDPFYMLEVEIWNNLSFDKELFCSTYGLNAEIFDGGLLVRANTIGGINTYVATFFCCSRSDYDHWPFSAAFGSGFLRSEETFRAMQQVLRRTPIYMLHADLAEIYSDLIISNRYHPLYVWCSNLLCDYFVEKHPSLMQIADVSKRLGTQTEPNFPEIDLVLLQDERTKVALPEPIDNIRNRSRPWSVHTRNFSRICKYMRGASNIEIISERSWFDEDNGISKLPNTDYVMVCDFLSSDTSATFDSIIVHILRGHGVAKEIYEQVVLKAYSLTGNLIILEHNRQSSDFCHLNIGATVDELRDILGMESIFDYGPGTHCDKRNLILVYRK